MRITSEMMSANALRRLNGRLEQYERSQSQLATGRRILRPSDDPGGASRAMTLRARLRAQTQTERNQADAVSWLRAADTALQTASNRYQRARDLTVRGASMSSPLERGALAQELREIRDGLVDLANTSHRGRPLFGGTAAADPVTGAEGAWTVSAAGSVNRRVGEEGETAVVNVLAGDAFGTGPDSIFAVLDEVIADLEAGDAARVSAGIGRLDDAFERLGTSMTRVGAITNRVETAQDRTASLTLDLRTELSAVEDVDIAEAVMELQLQQVAYEATLTALGRALPPSLGAFLR